MIHSDKKGSLTEAKIVPIDKSPQVQKIPGVLPLGEYYYQSMKDIDALLNNYLQHPKLK